MGSFRRSGHHGCGREFFYGYILTRVKTILLYLYDRAYIQCRRNPSKKKRVASCVSVRRIGASTRVAKTRKRTIRSLRPRFPPPRTPPRAPFWSKAAPSLFIAVNILLSPHNFVIDNDK